MTTTTRTRARRAVRTLAMAGSVALWAAAAMGQTPATTTPRTGYLPAGAVPDLLRVLPPPPEPGSILDNADLAIFRATRQLEGSPRWALAFSDNTLGTPALLNAFSCALDLHVRPEQAPALARLLSQANVDASAASTRAKDAFKRKRPYERESGQVCLPAAQATTLAARSADYPSGHATAGWMAGLLLAEVAPDRTSEVLARARAFGESRVVCGVHHVTAVEAGRMTAEAVLAALHGSPEFRADADAAREEVVLLRHNRTGRPAACNAEAAALAQRAY